MWCGLVWARFFSFRPDTEIHTIECGHESLSIYFVFSGNRRNYMHAYFWVFFEFLFGKKVIISLGIDQVQVYVTVLSTRWRSCLLFCWYIFHMSLRICSADTSACAQSAGHLKRSQARAQCPICIFFLFCPCSINHYRTKIECIKINQRRLLHTALKHCYPFATAPATYTLV